MDINRRGFIGALAAGSALSYSGVERALAQAGEDRGWGLYPYNAERTRNNPNGVRLPELNEVEEMWKSDVQPETVPVANDGNLYFGTEDGLRAIDAHTGDEVWEHETDGVVEAPPGVRDGTVYAGTDDEEFVAVDEITGEEEWSVSVDGGVTTSPMVTELEVLFGTENRYYCLDILEGEENWNVETRVAAEMSPLVADDKVIFADGALVFAYDRISGDEAWNGPSYVGGSMDEVTVEGTRVYAVGGSAIHTQRLRNGVDRWSQVVRGDIVGGPAIHNGSMYVGTDSGFLYSVDLSNDGNVDWNVEFDGEFIGAPVVVDGLLYGAVDDEAKVTLLAVDPSDGEVVGEYVVGQEQVEQDDDDDEVLGVSVIPYGGPTVAEGTAYIPSVEGVRALGELEEVPPTASFDMTPVSPVVDEVVSFDGSSSSEGTAPIESYDWSLRSEEGDGFGAEVESFEHIFEESGEWSVTVTVTDEEGLEDSATEEFFVGTPVDDEDEEDDQSGGRIEGVEDGPQERVNDDGLLPFTVDGDREQYLFGLGVVGAVVSALGFSAYWRMDSENGKVEQDDEDVPVCGDCGEEVDEDDLFCGNCGSDL